MSSRPPRSTAGDARSTEPLSNGAAHDVAGERERRIAIVIHHRDGAELAWLDAALPVVVGRALPSDLRVQDNKLSRTHARFRWVDGRVSVEDLGSRNGTWIGGRRVQQEMIDVDDEVTLGEVVARVHAIDAPGTPSRLENEGGFRRRLDDEVVRARHARRRFALLAVCATIRDPGGGAWVGALPALLRPFDRLGVHSSDTVLILLPETGPDVAAEIARALTEKLGGEPAIRRVGVAGFPDAATSSEELLELACRALARTSAAHPIEHAPAAAWVEHASSVPDAAVSVGAATRELFETVQRVATARAPVILYGETGTGKEVVARVLHASSARRERRMVRVNCGAIPAQLVESTLFGHEKGAFTGASQHHKGVFEEADRGTVFLDEIGELPLAAQAALLRVLETGCFSRVGATRELTVDVRVVAATHRDLRAMVEAGGFREDLYYRLDAIPLTIPPLRERRDEIEPLAFGFLRQANEANGRALRGIAPSVLDLLRAYAWPGNLRELRNTIERAVVIARGDAIGDDDLPTRIRDVRPSDSARAAAAVTAAPPEAAGEVRARVQRYEAQLVIEALSASAWNRAEAAKTLGMPLRTLAYKIKTLRIKEPAR